jgi:hypothetical protein
LRDAVREGHSAVAKVLHAAGGELGYNEVEASGELCELAKLGSVDRMNSLLECGVSVNAADCACDERANSGPEELRLQSS